MKIEFIFSGKTSEKWIEEGCAIYFKRIKNYFKGDIVVTYISVPASSADVQKKKESQLILQQIGLKDLVILLDEKGKQFTSREFASQLNKFITSGKAKILFVVGGAFGSDLLLQQRADVLLSFSGMTFTHQMIRPILFEQIYRAFTILKNEKYHH